MSSDGETVTPGRVAVVTGASSGVGRASAIHLSIAGFVVVLAGRRQPLLEVVADEVRAAGGSSRVFQCDVRSEQSVVDLFRMTAETFGRIDLLFNNAGVFTPSVAIEDVTLTDWQNSIATNLTGAFLCTREAVRLMKEQRPRGGRIINNGSISAHAPRADALAYTATKHAITGLTKSTSLDGRAFDFACGQIDIGNAASSMINADEPLLQADRTKRIEPTMDVADVARAVVYMSSLPLTANVQFMTVMATKMPYIGRG
jgi:NAD(P)-dependent dehydrogenase (short-subunit alcohol dehydrogenase family)